MEPQNRSTYYQQSRDHLEKAFSEHQLHFADHNVGRYIIKKPERSEYWAEIVIITQGVLVHGDIGTSVFKYYSGPKGEENLLGAVRWMHDANISYAFEKYCIGMSTTRHDAVSYVSGIALGDIRERINGIEDEDTDESETREAWEHAYTMVKRGDPREEIWAYLWENDPRCEGEDLGFGEVIPNVVLSAQYAMKTLLKLL